MKTIIFTDPIVLLSTVKKQIADGAKVELHDDSINRRLGYKVGGKISWMISITDLKRASTDPAKKDLVELFKTPKDRLKLCKIK